MTALRWLLIATHVPPTGSGGGMVRYTVSLAEALHARRDVHLEVLCDRAAMPWWTDLLGGPERVHPAPSLPTPARSAVERLGRGLPAADEPFDVVHGVKHLLPRRARGLRLLTVHDMLPLDRPWDFPLAKRTLLKGPYLASIRDADALVCVSAATRRRLTSYVPSARSRARVVPLAVSPRLHAAVAQPVPALRDRRFVLVVGDPSPRKNLATVVEAWPQVRTRHPDALLALVGPPGWGGGGGEAQADGVLALGHLSDGALRWCYENTSVVACPSVLEGFGLPSVEALSFGRPLITSEDPALCEASADSSARRVVGHDVHGWADALTEALTAPVRASRPRLPLRTWADVADETVGVVREAMRGK